MIKIIIVKINLCLVEFYSESLGIDRFNNIKKVLNSIVEKYNEKVNIIVVNLSGEEGKNYIDKYKIKSIPTQIYFDKNGLEYYRSTGFQTENEIEHILKQKNNFLNKNWPKKTIILAPFYY